MTGMIRNSSRNAAIASAIAAWVALNLFIRCRDPRVTYCADRQPRGLCQRKSFEGYFRLVSCCEVCHDLAATTGQREAERAVTEVEQQIRIARAPQYGRSF